MTPAQPEALRLAEMLTADEWPGSVTLVSYARECVAELLRQHAENETLRAGYAAARLEIESLKAQLHAAKQINAAQFGLLAASIPGSALRVPHGQAPAQLAQRFDAADMATAAAQGFRDGVASVSTGSASMASYAARLLVAAALVTRAKADEALRFAEGLTAAPGPADGESNG